MARLPQSLDVAAPSGERASTATVRPTDFGLGDVARAVDAFAEVQAKRDDQKAAEILQAEQAKHEPEFAARAAAYDGREPGFAAAEVEGFDGRFASLLERPDLTSGQRAALRQRMDAYKTQFGARAIGAESQRRGAVVAEQARVTEQLEVDQELFAFEATWAKDVQEAEAAFDGSQPRYAEGLMARFDERADAQLAAVPEARRGAVALALSARRAKEFAYAMKAQDQGHLALVAGKAQTQGNSLANSVLSHPAGYAAAIDLAERLGEGLPAPLRSKYVAEVKGDLVTARVQGLLDQGKFAEAQQELSAGSYDRLITPEQKARLVDAARAGAAGRVRDLLEAARYGEGDPDELLAAAAASGDEGLAARAEYVALVGAATPGALSGGGASGGFNAAFEFTYAREGGDQIIPNDNGRGPSRGGINQAAHPDVDVTKLTPVQQKARYRRYWQAVGADRLPPGMAMAAFDAAVLHGEDDAKRWLGQADGDVGTFLALQRGYMRQLAKDDPAKYGDDLKGWLNRTVKVEKEAARLDALANAQEGLSSDPIKYAMGTAKRAPLARISELPDSPDAPGWGEALKGRLAVGRMMNQRYRAPMRMLTEGEQTFYRDQIERDPMAGIAFAGKALESVGPAAAKGLLAEVGLKDSASVQLHLADLAAGGQANFARTAATGLALRAKGSELAKDLKDDIAADVEARKALFAGQPELLGVVRAAAEAAALAQSATGTAQRASANVNSALGGSTRNGRLYGGVGEVNGQAVILPQWLAQDHADDVLEFLAQGFAGKAQGPVWANGAEIPAESVARMTMRLMPNGKYRLLDRRGVAMLAQGGGAFEFDLDAAAPGLRRQFGVGVVQDGW